MIHNKYNFYASMCVNRSTAKYVCIICMMVLFTCVTYAVSADTLRTWLRDNARSAGVVLTNVWTRVDADRKLAIMGGTLTSTQQLYTLCMTLTNLQPFVTSVEQSITTPEGNPFPDTFAVGYVPDLSTNSPDTEIPVP